MFPCLMKWSFYTLHYTTYKFLIFIIWDYLWLARWISDKQNFCYRNNFYESQNHIYRKRNPLYLSYFVDWHCFTKWPLSHPSILCLMSRCQLKTRLLSRYVDSPTYHRVHLMFHRKKTKNGLSINLIKKYSLG